jgi:hypothetical protein
VKAQRRQGTDLRSTQIRFLWKSRIGIEKTRAAAMSATKQQCRFISTTLPCKRESGQRENGRGVQPWQYDSSDHAAGNL